MKRFYVLYLFCCLLGKTAQSQDISISSVASPVSGCNISCSDNLVIFIANSPVPIGTAFIARYNINGGPFVTETISTFLGSSAIYTYTFFTDPVLCAPGTYRIFIEVDLPGDINPANDTLSVTVVNDVTVIPGVFSGSDTVCTNANAGVVTLSGYTGHIGQWEYSTNSGSSWSPLPDTGHTHAYINLDTTTLFHVLIEGGYCPDGVSPTVKIQVDEPSEGGFLVASSTTVCATSNAGAVNLTGTSGNVIGWAYSIDGGTVFSPIANTTNTEYFNDLSHTTIYQAIVQNGACPPDSSAPVTITVDAPGVAGTVASDTNVCEGTAGHLELTGYSGNIYCWLSSTNGGLTWDTPIINHDPTQGYTGTVSITYTAVVQNGVCPSDTAAPATVNILPLPLAYAGPDDTLYVGDTLCFNATGGIGYLWTPADYLNNSNIPNPCMSGAPAGMYSYTVQVTDHQGCQDSDDLVMLVIDTAATEPIDSLPTVTELVVCNFMTPNDDGDNDVWNILGIEQFPDNKVIILNNHGQIVFEQSSYKNDWKGGGLPDGSYCYLVKVPATDKTLKGVLTISGSR